MKAIFDINEMFKTILDVPSGCPEYYFAITENRWDLLLYPKEELPRYHRDKKMVFERVGSDSMMIDDKLQYVLTYRFREFVD